MPGYFQIFHALNCTNYKKCRVGNIYCCGKETSPLSKSPRSLSLSLPVDQICVVCVTYWSLTFQTRAETDVCDQRLLFISQTKEDKVKETVRWKQMIQKGSVERKPR